jgi:hypothetical protein
LWGAVGWVWGFWVWLGGFVGGGWVGVGGGPSPRVTTAVMVVKGRVRVWVTTRVRGERARAVTFMVVVFVGVGLE